MCCFASSSYTNKWFTPRNGIRRSGASEEQEAIRHPDTVEKEKFFMSSRLRTKYDTELKESVKKELGISNPMAVPRLEKIVINMGLGEATQNVKIMDPLVADLASIAGQKPVTTKAKKSIAQFKVREGMPIGAMVTLRGDNMYEFLDRLISIALPRVRDFRGVSSKSFDGRGNYTLGLRDQLIFAEIDYAKVDKLKGMNVTIVTTAQDDNGARALLKAFGMPFRQGA
jgi:large subunit ribosomal protein L5